MTHTLEVDDSKRNINSKEKIDTKTALQVGYSTKTKAMGLEIKTNKQVRTGVDVMKETEAKNV